MAFVVCLVVLVVIQGGFYVWEAGAVGALALLLLIPVALKSRPQRAALAIPGLLLLIGCIVAVGALVNGDSDTALLESIRWLALVPLALFPAWMSGAQRMMVVRGLGWSAVVMATLALLLYAGNNTEIGVVASGRLQFTFQYANAAGIWFAVGYLLALCPASSLDATLDVTHSQGSLRRYACIVLCAVVATKSVGAICVLASAMVVLLVRYLIQKNLQASASIVADGLVGALFAALCVLFDAQFAPLFALIAFAVVRLPADKILPVLKENTLRIAIVVAAVAVIFACVLIAVFAPERLIEASGTFAERLSQIGDGLVLLGAAPLLGIGPDAWAHSYQAVQSVEYVASRIHCGYLQIALDGGIFALAAFLVAMIGGCVVLARQLQDPRTLPHQRNYDWLVLVALVMVLVQALVDFTFSFAAILALAVFLAQFAMPTPYQKAASD